MAKSGPELALCLVLRRIAAFFVSCIVDGQGLDLAAVRLLGVLQVRLLLAN